jgi:SAM-dependent MidA family methyltransferase
LNDKPLERIGEQDITADVNFSALIEYGGEMGLIYRRLMRQADYLIGLGLLDRLQRMMESGEQDFQSLKTRLALKNFFVPGGISDHFKVLVQEKK